MFRSFIIDLALGQNIFENSIKKQMQDCSTAEQLGQTGGLSIINDLPKAGKCGWQEPVLSPRYERRRGFRSFSSAGLTWRLVV